MNKLDELSKRVCDHLGLDILPYKFEDLGIEDSRLYLKEEYIGIHIKYKDDYIECAKSLTHEYRHVFQIYYVHVFDDNISKLWREALSKQVNSNNMKNDREYIEQALEIDAFAFTKYYLEQYENIKVVNKISGLDKWLDKYIVNNERIM